MSRRLHYVTDPMHTFVTFGVMHFATSTLRARFDDVAGTIDVDWDAHTGHADIVIDTASVNSGTVEFNKHLKSDMFFDVVKYPDARFVGDDFKWQDGMLASVAGRLTLHGQTHPVTLKCLHFNRYDSPVHNAPVAGGDFGTTIQRSQWGVDWGVDKGVPDAVKLLIQIEGVQQQP